MTDAFLISRRLHIGYKVNGTLNVLRRLPLLKRILPGDIYSKSWIKTVVLIFKVLGEIFSIFFGKIIYLGVMIALPCILLKENSISSASPAGIALNIFFFLTLLGTLIHNPLFDPSDEMYYAVFLMRMNARDYSMSNYIYSLIKDIVGFFIVIAICSAVISGLEFSSILLILLPLYVAGAKLCVSLFQLFFFRKHGFLFTGDAPKAGKFVWILVVLLLAAAYVPAVLSTVLPENAVMILCALAVPCGAVSLILLLKAPDHRRVLKYVEFKNRGMISADDHTVSEAVKEGYLKKLDSNDLSAGSGKTGCSYFNDIFVKRHRKLLTRTAKRQAVVLAVLFAAACAACVLLPDTAKEINSRLLGVLPIFL